eukprot:CAMPEP_0203666392 /NCGR_PEP_ID=MMETSP0090-20130426/3439_1 /ASSEMBLY_ACC=CAM_ASM_001088 /TAXON_ID=426623 /ORGANISM="Chaetoceros affinis, Strain CCMP159" /LENGTH=85 /DNA_ID=CAMNT_0050530259 /DNA_START=47 /DNA_END=304 /DNA_ORIENTATION=-
MNTFYILVNGKVSREVGVPASCACRAELSNELSFGSKSEPDLNLATMVGLGVVDADALGGTGRSEVCRSVGQVVIVVEPSDGGCF